MTSNNLYIIAAFIMISNGAIASSVDIGTPCSAIKSAISQNDIIAGQETRSVIVRWLLANDKLHILQTQDQFEAVARESAGRCIHGDSATLQSALKTTYQHWAGMIYNYQKSQSDYYDKQNRHAQEYHQKVMHDLDQ